jgi:hypothetical protein
VKVGLLWFDDDPGRRLEDKVLRAAAHYERKYGQPPNLCFAHAAALGDSGRPRKAGAVEIHAGCSVLHTTSGSGSPKTARAGLSRGDYLPVSTKPAAR